MNSKTVLCTVTIFVIGLFISTFFVIDKIPER